MVFPSEFTESTVRVQLLPQELVEVDVDVVVELVVEEDEEDSEVEDDEVVELEEEREEEEVEVMELDEEDDELPVVVELLEVDDEPLLEDEELLPEVVDDEEDDDEPELELELDVETLNWYVSPPQKPVFPVEAISDAPDNTSRAPARGRLYFATSNVSVEGELPEFVALTSTVDPETISAVSPAGTF